MATHGARRVATMALNARHIIAIEFLCACQGIDFHAPCKTSPRLQQAHEALRTHVPFMAEDRILADDIAAASAILGSEPVQSLARELQLQ